MSSTAAKKGAFTSQGVCRIIETCGKHGVLEIHFGEVSIFFTPERQLLAHQSRKPTRKDKLPVARDPLFPETDVEKEALEGEQERIRAEQLAELVLRDPMEAERLAIEAVEKDLIMEEEDDGED